MRSGESRRIFNRPLVDIVRERLIEDIIEKRFHPGDKLPVVELANQYGVSETPVKHAFNRLISEGMLVAEPRRGVRVRRISADSMRELMEARHMVHLYSVDSVMSAMRNPEGKTAKEIEANLRRHKEILENLSQRMDFAFFLEYFKVEKEYHFIYLRCLDNRTIERIFDQLYNQAYIYMTMSEEMAHRILTAYQDHLAIYEACKSGDRTGVVALLEKHKAGAVLTMKKIFLDGES